MPRRMLRENAKQRMISAENDWIRFLSFVITRTCYGRNTWFNLKLILPPLDNKNTNGVGKKTFSAELLGRHGRGKGEACVIQVLSHPEAYGMNEWEDRASFSLR